MKKTLNKMLESIESHKENVPEQLYINLCASLVDAYRKMPPLEYYRVYFYRFEIVETEYGYRHIEACQRSIIARRVECQPMHFESVLKHCVITDDLVEKDLPVLVDDSRGNGMCFVYSVVLEGDDGESDASETI